jgi:hypothetical protein
MQEIFKMKCEDFETGKNISFKHSGRIGDIIYSLPFIKGLCERKNIKAKIFISSDTPSGLSEDVYHPSGSLMVDQKLYDFIKPLLDQPYIQEIYYKDKNDMPADAYDLDQFRTAKINHKSGSIPVWFRKIFGIPYDITEPWLVLPHYDTVSDIYKDYVVISKSTRFCNNAINYEFLNQIEKKIFIGLEYEFDIFKEKNKIPNLEFKKVNNALELAHIISKCRLFIGNQSFNFAVAEALKSTRALEVFEPIPNVIPIGGICIEFITTEQICNFVSDITKERIDATNDRNEGYELSVLRKNTNNSLLDHILKILKFKNTRKYLKL